MTTPPPSEKWVPLWPNEQPKPEVPPAVNGRYLRAPPSWENPTPTLVTPDTGWHVLGAAGEPAFQNGWANYGDPYGPGRFRKTSDGLVICEGLITSGTAGATAFTLPVGYRPQLQPTGSGAIWHFRCASQNVSPWGSLWVYNTGEVRPEHVGWNALDGVVFLADSVPSAQTFKPTDLLGLVVWLDGPALGLADGATINTWPNLAPGGASVVFGGTPNPTVRASVKGCIPRFRAGQGFITVNPGVDKDYTIVFYAKQVGPTKGRVLSSPVLNSLAGWHSTEMHCLHMGAWADPNPQVLDDLGWKVYSVDGSTVTNRSRLFNAGALTATVTNPPSGWAGGIQFSGFYGGQTSDCELGELVMYNRRLSDTDRVQVENYMRRRWVL